MAAAQASGNHRDEGGLTWYLQWEIYKSSPTWTHSQNCSRSTEFNSPDITNIQAFLMATNFEMDFSAVYHPWTLVLRPYAYITPSLSAGPEIDFHKNTAWRGVSTFPSCWEVMLRTWGELGLGGMSKNIWIQFSENVFCCDLTFINLKLFPNHGGIYRF